MALSIVKKKRSRHVMPERPPFSLDDRGMRLRTKNMLAVFNVSHSTFYAGMAEERYPQPDGYDRRMPFWITCSVRKWLEEKRRARRDSALLG